MHTADPHVSKHDLEQAAKLYTTKNKTLRKETKGQKHLKVTLRWLSVSGQIYLYPGIARTS